MVHTVLVVRLHLRSVGVSVGCFVALVDVVLWFLVFGILYGGSMLICLFQVGGCMRMCLGAFCMIDALLARSFVAVYMRTASLY